MPLDFVEQSSASTDADVPSSLVNGFQELSSAAPLLFRAPGRVNLIGEHTDYNDGFVLPAAIGFYTLIAAKRRNDRLLRVRSVQFNETVELSLDNLAGGPRHHWSDYVRGVAAVMQSAGHTLCGAELLIDGQVPLGAGLSSSASLEMSTALALSTISGLAIPLLDMALISQKAEHEYAGTKCGIMDQFIAAFGKAGHALMLDCRSLEYSLLPLSTDAKLVICNSRVKHELASGEYNNRRAQCEEGVRLLLPVLPGIVKLRDVTVDQLNEHEALLSEVVYRRCRHVVTENARVEAAAAALKAGELESFGELMIASHRSLRDDYEVSCKELDILVELALRCKGVYGARMTGGGFGGCTVNMVKSEDAENFRQAMLKEYRKATGIEPDVFICSAADGASIVEQLS